LSLSWFESKEIGADGGGILKEAPGTVPVVSMMHTLIEQALFQGVIAKRTVLCPKR